MDPEKVNYHYCDDLPTTPLSPDTKVLVTGANGYVGRRLIPELVHRGYFVRCMYRIKRSKPLLEHPRIEAVYADCLKKEELREALKGMDVAYYLIHSMRNKKNEFLEKDKDAAKNFIEIAEECGIKKIIYLGGLGETLEALSPHLKSRREVGNILADTERITVVRLRAAIIIGTGSSPYELIKSMVLHNRLVPFLPELNSRCQPVSIRDVIKYLVGVLETENLPSRVFQIGGMDALLYQDLIETFASLVHKKVRFFDATNVPLSFETLCRIYAHWLNIFVSLPINMISLLLESLKTDVVCTENDIRKILPFEPLGFKTMVEYALEREKKLQVFSHWSDVPPDQMSDLLPLSEYESSEFIVAEHSMEIPAPAGAIFQAICQIGGKNGWAHATFLWEVRGLIDRILGGVGLRRGRRDENQLWVGDSVDFWRVERLEPDRELLLRAEMISPGISWLQFEIVHLENGNSRLTLKAHFIPKPFWGKVYWFILRGFHTYIFEGLLDYFHRKTALESK